MSTRQHNMSTQKIFGKIAQSRQAVDIFRRPLDNLDGLTERARTRNRQTQITSSDLPFQIIRAEGSWLLIQLVDDTFGWVPKKYVRELSKYKIGANIQKALKGKTIPVPSPSRGTVDTKLKQFAGIPYLWGGTTKAGMDCSAFTQKLFLDLFGILLPRNSREQKKCGTFVQSTKICPLDIIFFVHKTSGRHHVGVYWGDKVHHFCLDKNGMSTECLLDIKKRYRYLTARRIIQKK